MSKRKQGHSARERGDEQRALDEAPALGRAGHFLRAALALRPPEPPPMAAELWRHRTCVGLRERLLRACGKGTPQSRYPSLSFERWLFAAHRTVLDEPLIPTPPADGEHAAEPGLVADLVAVGFGASKARDIALELAAAARTAVAHKARDALASSEIVSAQRDAEAITLKSGGVQFRLHWGVYERLAALHCAALASLDLAGESAALAPSAAVVPSAALALLRADAPKLARFHSAAFKMLLRYDALSGPGFQAALGATHFARLGAAVELFASPFNCVNTTYGSAFYDTDAAFGSLGSCFDWFPRVTAATMAVAEPVEFEANPPFVSALMLRLARMLIDARPLHTRVHLVVPSWCDQPYHAALRAAFPAAAASLERLTGAANEWIQVPDCKSGGRPHVRVVPTVTELWHLQPELADAAAAVATVEVEAQAKSKGDHIVPPEEAGDEADEARRKRRKAERRALRAGAERAE
jgi:hypothetical protein